MSLVSVESKNHQWNIYIYICLVEVTINGVSKFVLGAVYIHPNASSSAIECCIYRSQLEYSKSIRKIIPSIELDLHTPMIITGDFNFDVPRDVHLTFRLRRPRLVTLVLI
jgi:hypothetical protein